MTWQSWPVGESATTTALFISMSDLAQLQVAIQSRLRVSAREVQPSMPALQALRLQAAWQRHDPRARLTLWRAPNGQKGVATDCAALNPTRQSMDAQKPSRRQCKRWRPWFQMSGVASLTTDYTMMIVSGKQHHQSGTKGSIRCLPSVRHPCGCASWQMVTTAVARASSNARHERPPAGEL